MKMAWGRCLLGFFVALLLVTSSVSKAQTTTAQISGTVIDPQGLALANATVTVREQSTGDSRTTTTDATGNFVFPALVPGTYQLQVEASGFKTLQQTGLQLSASEK